MINTKYSYVIVSDNLTLTQESLTPILNYYFSDFRDVLGAVYNLMFEQKYPNMKVAIYCVNVQISVFNVCYKNGLVLWNSDNHIKVASIYPEYVAMDLTLEKHFKNTNTSGSLPNQYSSLSGDNTVSKKISYKPVRHCKLLERGSQVVTNNQNNKPLIDKKVKITRPPDCVNNNNAKNISFITSNDNLRIFDSDKRAYIKIKKDIDNNIISSSDINPCFSLKYHIFRILDGRKSIDFNSNDNIQQEFDLFQVIYDNCNNDDDCDDIGNDEDNNTDNNRKPDKKVYIPHNYHFMTRDKKEQYAATYRMTLKDFEDKYINGTIQNDIIDNHINNGCIQISKSSIELGNIPEESSSTICSSCSKNSSNSSGSSDSYDSDETESSDYPVIDNNFIELAKQYNNQKRNLVVV